LQGLFGGHLLGRGAEGLDLVFGWVACDQRNQRRTDLRRQRQQEAARKRRAAFDQVFLRPV
jgi:hypothetical protein